jgi:hypothetical protein
MNARRRHQVPVALAVLAAVLAAGSAASVRAAAAGAGADHPRSSYRWTDEKGVVHYGDVVPPEYAMAGRSELDQQGVEISRVSAQMSPEDAERDQQRRDLEARDKQHDQFLLTTYTSSRDIEQLRDERIALIDGQVSASRARLDEMRSRIESLVVRAQNFKPYASNESARRMPDALAEELVRAVREREALQLALATKQAELIEVRQRFDADLNRYKELGDERRARR